MSYVKHEWKSGDIVSSKNLNEMEDGIFNSQEKITVDAKLSADLLAEGTTNKLVSEAEKTNWNNKSNVSVPTASESNTEAKYLKIGENEYKLATGEGKKWINIDLSAEEIIALAKGKSITKSFLSTGTQYYDDTNFKNDYFMTTVAQKLYENPYMIYWGQPMEKVFTSIDNISTIVSYIAKSIVSAVKDYSFNHHYYKTIALFAGCTEEEGKTASSIDGNDVILVYDVSQQTWEYNYDDDKMAVVAKRDQLSNDVIGTALVFSIKGQDAANSGAFLLCLEDSQAAYWHESTGSEDPSRLRWANINAGSVYPVYFDPATSGHYTERWLLTHTRDPKETEEREGKYGEEITKPEKDAFLAGFNFSVTDRKYKLCAAEIHDSVLGFNAPCLGVGDNYLANIFSFNESFGELKDQYLQYIGRPDAYQHSTITYTKGTEQQTETDGYYLWTCDVDGVLIELIVPDNYYLDPGAKKPTPHRDSYVVRINTQNSLDTNTIYRHTFSINSGANLDIGEYEVNLCMCAVNSEYGDSTPEYLLHSDESHQNVDWVLPVSGTIGRVIGLTMKGEVLKPTDKDGLTKVMINCNYPYSKFDDFWDQLPKQYNDTYYMFAADYTVNGDELTNKIRMRVEKVASETNNTYDFYVYANEEHAGYRLVTEGTAPGWFAWQEDHYESLGAYELEFFVASEFSGAAVRGIEAMTVGTDPQVTVILGWDNAAFIELFAANRDYFGTMYKVAHVFQAIKMSAGWQETEDGELRTLYLFYIDQAGEQNKVPVITDNNSWKYNVRDFISVVLNVKTPMSSKIYK